MSSDRETIDRLTRERDLAVTVAREAMRLMADGQLAELRSVLGDDAMHRLPVDNHQLRA